MEASAALDLLAFHERLSGSLGRSPDPPAGSLAALIESNGSDGIWMMIQMVEQSPVSVIVTSPQGQIEYVNDRFTALTGYSRSEVIGHTPNILRSGLTPPETHETMWATIPTGIWRGEFVNRKKNGELYWEAAIIGPVRDALGRVTHYLAIKEDITEQKQIAAEHRVLKETFRLAAGLASDLVYEFDRQTMRITVFTPLKPEWGMERAPCTAAEWLVTVHPEDRERVYSAFLDSIEHGTRFDQEYRTERDDGGFSTWQNRADPVHDASGNVLKWVGVMVDVSREREVRAQLSELARRLRSKNRQLREALRRAEAATEMKTRFLANMSHEIRTPLNGIIGTAEMLLNLEPTPEQYECAHVIRDCGLSLLTVLNDILDISKLEAGKMKVERIRFEPARTVTEVLSLMRPLADAKRLGLEFECSSDVPRCLVGDPSRLSQILSNLVSNAIKFTQAGSVTICVSRMENADGEHLEYTVMDTGIGIATDKLHSIFESFVQVDDSPTRKFGGTGLGLAISQQLANLMGGRIEVASTPGQGSRFTLRLPVERPAPRVAEPPPRPVAGDASSGPRTGLILLAEDNALNQRIVGRLLEKAGYTVLRANNGKEVLKVIDSRPVDLILMDVQMPEMDGVEAARRLRASGPEAQSIPIIALTANAMPGDRELYLAAGMDDYIAKPISYADLLAKVRQWIRPGVSTGPCISS